MSRILKQKKKLFIYAAGLVMGAVLVGTFTKTICVTAVVCVLYLAMVILNELVCRKLNRQNEPFGIYSGIRNVDYLMIGDYCDIRKYISDGGVHVELFAPGRGYKGAFQILRHTHSILKEEGGTVIMTVGKSKKAYTVFDIPFFHELTIKKAGLGTLKKMSRFPLIFEPVNSLKFLAGGARNAYVPSEDIPNDLRTFCDERNYHLILLKKV